MALSSFTTLGTALQLLLRTTGGPNASGWEDSSDAGNDASLADAGAAPDILADPLGDGSGPAAGITAADAGYDSGLDLTGQSTVTLFSLFRFTVASGFQNVWADSAPDGDEFSLYRDTSTLYLWNGSSLQFVATVSNNQDYKVAVVYDAGVATIYFDDAVTPVGSIAVGQGTHPNPLFWGSFGTQNPLRGNLYATGAYSQAVDIPGLFAAMDEELAGVADPASFPTPEVPVGFDASTLPPGAILWPDPTVPAEFDFEPEVGAEVVPIQYTDGAGVWYAALLNGSITKVTLVTPSGFSPTLPTAGEQAVLDAKAADQASIQALLTTLESQDLTLAQVNTLLRNLLTAG